VLDAFGHISARDPDNPQRYWLSTSKAPGLVQPDDLMEFDLDSNAIDARGRRTFVERFIHGEIYKARPDVHSVIHAHPPNLIAFCNSDTKLRPMTQTAAFLGDGPPNWDIRSIDDGGDMLVRNAGQARSLAETLGRHAIVLMRGHGITLVGETVREAVRRAVAAEANAVQQLQAALLGPVKFLSEAETRVSSRPMADSERGWELWRQDARRRLA
jgi:HCOMODA/2-hydroxy-3-carboxy-muconic semialdehyde decarboxylase